MPSENRQQLREVIAEKYIKFKNINALTPDNEAMLDFALNYTVSKINITADDRLQGGGTEEFKNRLGLGLMTHYDSSEDKTQPIRLSFDFMVHNTLSDMLREMSHHDINALHPGPSIQLLLDFQNNTIIRSQYEGRVKVPIYPAVQEPEPAS